MFMFSPEFMKFLVGRDINDYLAAEKEEVVKENKIFRYSKLATVPIEIKE